MKKLPFLSFLDLRWKLCSHWPKKIGRVVKTAFYVSTGTYWGKCFWRYVLFQFRASTKNCGLWLRGFKGTVRTAWFLARAVFCAKTFFFEENTLSPSFSNFQCNFFGHLAKEKWPELSKPHSKNPQSHFEPKTFWKKNLCQFRVFGDKHPNFGWEYTNWLSEPHLFQPEQYF